MEVRIVQVLGWEFLVEVRPEFRILEAKQIHRQAFSREDAERFIPLCVAD